MGDVWLSADLLPDGEYQTVYAPVAGSPAPIGPGAVIDPAQAAAIIRDLGLWLEQDVATPTARRLARALREAGAPHGVVAAALAGHYDDNVSSEEFPTLHLIDDLTAAGMTAMVVRVEAGEFDSPVPVRRLAAA